MEFIYVVYLISTTYMLYYTRLTTMDDSTKFDNGMLVRWSMSLATNLYTVHYRKGLENKVSD